MNNFEKGEYIIYMVDTITGKVISQWDSEIDFVDTTLPVGWYKKIEEKGNNGRD